MDEYNKKKLELKNFLGNRIICIFSGRCDLFSPYVCRTANKCSWKFHVSDSEGRGSAHC